MKKRYRWVVRRVCLPQTLRYKVNEEVGDRVHFQKLSPPSNFDRMGLAAAGRGLPYCGFKLRIQGEVCQSAEPSSPPQQRKLALLAFLFAEAEAVCEQGE